MIFFYFWKSIVISKCEYLISSKMLAVFRILHCRFLETVNIFEIMKLHNRKYFSLQWMVGVSSSTEVHNRFFNFRKWMFSELDKPGGIVHFRRYGLHSKFPMYIQNLNVCELDHIRSNTFVSRTYRCIHAHYTKFWILWSRKIPDTNGVLEHYSKFWTSTNIF